MISTMILLGSLLKLATGHKAERETTLISLARQRMLRRR